MRFSVIIPSYNQEQYLPDAIGSVIDQTYKDFELIVVDDGSTDASMGVARSYHGLKVVSQVNKGLSAARNTGIMNASGEWCVFLDADDIMAPNYLEVVDKAIRDNPAADMVAPSLKEFGMSSATVILMPGPTLVDFRAGNRVGYCQAIRRDALLEVGGYSPRMAEGYEDLHLTCDLLYRGKHLITLPDVLWLYRTKEQSMITTAKQNHDKLLAQINKDVPGAQLNFEA